MSAANNSNATEGRAPTAGRCERSEQLQRDRRSRAHREAAKLAGRNAARRANALFELVTGRHAATLEPTGGAVVATGRASVLLTCPLDTLLDPDCSTSA